MDSLRVGKPHFSSARGPDTVGSAGERVGAVHPAIPINDTAAFGYNTPPTAVATSQSDHGQPSAVLDPNPSPRFTRGGSSYTVPMRSSAAGDGEGLIDSFGHQPPSQGQLLRKSVLDNLDITLAHVNVDPPHTLRNHNDSGTPADAVQRIQDAPDQFWDEGTGVMLRNMARLGQEGLHHHAIGGYTYTPLRMQGLPDSHVGASGPGTKTPGDSHSAYQTDHNGFDTDPINPQFYKNRDHPATAHITDAVSLDPIGPPRSAPLVSHDIPFTRRSTAAVSDVHSDDPVAGAQLHLSALSTLIERLVARGDQLEEAKKEAGMWKEAWASTEKQRKVLETQIAGMRDIGIGPKFSTVLIDGDGLIFTDELLRAGFKGGQRAARCLLSSLPPMLHHAKTTSNGGSLAPDQTEPTIASVTDAAQIAIGDDEKKRTVAAEDFMFGTAIVSVFLNKSGLGSTLVKAGILPSHAIFDAFWQGFSGSHELFSVVDVGPGKEATDAKIREHLRFYVCNVQCKMIVLGASHDNGYANILSSLSTENRLAKLLLLRGYSDLAGQLKQYSNRVVTIPNLFRRDKIPLSFSSVAAAKSTKKRETGQETAPLCRKSFSTPAPRPDAVSDADVCNAVEFRGDNLDSAISSPSLPPTAAAVNTAEVPSDVESATGAHADTGAMGDPEVTSRQRGWTTVPRIKAKPTGVHGKQAGRVRDSFNKKDRKEYTRDKPPPRRGWAVRELDPRPCHTYYLSDRGCRNGVDCGYAHDYELTDDATEELRRLAKEMVCPYARNNKCHFTEAECVYGHQCPRADGCKFGDTCRFRHLDNGHGRT